GMPRHPRIFSLLAVLLVAAMLLTACPAQPGAMPGAGLEPEQAPPAAVNPEFDNADTYIYVTYGEPQTLDPSWTYETAGSAVESNIYEGLVWFNKDQTGDFVPLLSTGWEVNEDGTQWVFDVREGVTFHEGGT